MSVLALSEPDIPVCLAHKTLIPWCGKLGYAVWVLIYFYLANKSGLTVQALVKSVADKNIWEERCF